MNSAHESATASAPRRLPPLNMLRAFEAAGRLGSVTRAAQELHVTQSAVSHQIKALEEWLGAALVARDGRRLALTPQGSAYLPSLSNALDVMAHATSRIERQATRRTLSVNALPTLASQWLIPQLPRFRELMPEIDVQLATTTSVLDFEPHAYDVVLRCLSDVERTALQARPGWREVRLGRFLPDAVMTPMCSPDWLARGPALKKPADLRHHTLLHSRSTPMVWRDWLAQARADKLEPAGALVFDHAHLAVQAAVQGLGIALGNPSLVRDMLDNRLLVAPFADITIPENDFFWIFPPRSQDNAAAHAFCRWLESCV